MVRLFDFCLNDFCDEHFANKKLQTSKYGVTFNGLRSKRPCESQLLFLQFPQKRHEMLKNKRGKCIENLHVEIRNQDLESKVP